jgi:hypothetical protein
MFCFEVREIVFCRVPCGRLPVHGKNRHHFVSDIKSFHFQSCFSLDEKLLPLATETLDQNVGIFRGWNYDFQITFKNDCSLDRALLL